MKSDIPYYARSFAELVLAWSRDGVEIYKHEMRAAADLMIERIEAEETT